MADGIMSDFSYAIIVAFLLSEPKHMWL